MLSSTLTFFHSKKHVLTSSVFSQHVQKLRKSRDTSTLATEQSGAPTKGNTPRKAATPRKRATPKKKPAETPEAVSDTGDAEKLKFEEASDDEVDMKPMKPAKRSKKKKELEEEVKEEDEEEQTEV